MRRSEERRNITQNTPARVSESSAAMVLWFVINIKEAEGKKKMRINVYSQELTDEVLLISKESNTGIVYHAAQLILHSSEKPHHPPQDDDSSAVTFWLPKSQERREEMAKAFEKLAETFRAAPPETGLD